MEAFTFLKYWRGGGAGANGRTAATEIITAPLETDGESDGEDGPFFDLEFAEADENEPGQPEPDSGLTSTDSESDEEFNVLPVSPSDDLFSKGESVPVQTDTEPDTDLNIKSQFSRLKSATNFRVLMLKLKKNKENAGEKKKKVKKETNNKFFTVKFKLEEIPIKSVFKRDNSSKSGASTKKPEGVEEKKVSKDVMQRYLKMVKILKRNGGGAAVDAAEVEVVPARRKDDSLVQQQDGIQSAILHCKRSFNASRELEFSILSRSVSDPSSVSDSSHDHKLVNTLMKNCSDKPQSSVFENDTS